MKNEISSMTHLFKKQIIYGMNSQQATKARNSKNNKFNNKKKRMESNK